VRPQICGFPGRKKMRLPRKNLEKLFKFESLNQENEIKKALTEAIELDPNNANFHFILRKKYLINRDIEKDESEFKKVSS
jgi:hypothetical protein